MQRRETILIYIFRSVATISTSSAINCEKRCALNGATQSKKKLTCNQTQSSRLKKTISTCCSESPRWRGDVEGLGRVKCITTSFATYNVHAISTTTRLPTKTNHIADRFHRMMVMVLEMMISIGYESCQLSWLARWRWPCHH